MLPYKMKCIEGSATDLKLKLASPALNKTTTYKLKHHKYLDKSLKQWNFSNNTSFGKFNQNVMTCLE